MNQHKLAWMMAHIRLNSKASPAYWKIDEVISAFVILPEPEIPFEEWCAKMGISLAPAEPQKPTPNQIEKANDNAIAALGPRAQVFPRDVDPQSVKKKPAKKDEPKPTDAK